MFDCLFGWKITGNSNAQQSTIPPTIDEESANVTTGNGDATHQHAPMLQVSSKISYNIIQSTSK